MQFYILTSTNYDALVRHFDSKYSNIEKEDAVVVINTLNEKYSAQAEDFCKENNIEYYITESNGTPAKGKNSVLDIFLESNNDYCVMVDGDDFLTPHGVWMYKNLEVMDNPPDAICLINQKSYRYVKNTLYALQPFTVDYSDLLSSDYYTMFKNEYKLSEEKSKYFESLHYKFYAQHRNFYTTDETPATYVYDERNAGTVMAVSKFGSDYEWMDAYLNELKKMEDENKLHENVKLPELKIDYPVVYNKSDYKLTDKYIHKYNDINVELPRNATEKSIRKSYLYLKKYAA